MEDFKKKLVYYQPTKQTFGKCMKGFFCHNVYHETAIACFLWQQKHSRDSSRLVINYPDQSSSQSFQTGAGDRTGSGSVRPNKYCYWLTYNGQGYWKKDIWTAPGKDKIKNFYLCMDSVWCYLQRHLLSCWTHNFLFLLIFLS